MAESFSTEAILMVSGQEKWKNVFDKAGKQVKGFTDKIAEAGKKLPKFDGDFEKLSKNMQKASKKMDKAGNAMFKAVSVPLAGIATAGVKYGAEFEATGAQFSQVFGDMEKDAEKSLKEIADETGILEGRLKGSFAQIAAFAKTTGMDTAESLELTERATMLAADSAAFYDRSIESVTDSLQSFLKGNYANDAALGISATETTRNAKANELYGQSFIDLSEAQKQLTLLAMVEDGNKLSGALGQAARESDTLENQMGNLQQQAKETLATIAEPLIEPTIDVMKELADVLGKVAKWFEELDEEQQKTIVSLGLVAVAAGPVLKVGGKLVSGLDKGITGIANFSKTAGKLPKTLLGVGGVVAALGAVVTVAKEVYDNVNWAGTAFRKIKGDMDETSKSFSDGVGSAEAQAVLVEELGTELETLAGKTSLTADEMLTARTAADQWNSLMPNMQVTIDTQSGKISGLADDWRDLAKAQQDAALVEASQKSFSESAESMIEAKKVEIKAKRELNEVLAKQGKTLDDAKYSYENYNEAVLAAAGKYVPSFLNDDLLELIVTYEQYVIAVQGVTEVEAASAEKMEFMRGVLADYGIDLEALSESADGAADGIEGFADDSTEALEEMEDEQKAILESLISEVEQYQQELQQTTADHHASLNALTDEGYQQQEITMAGWLDSMLQRQQTALEMQENLAILKGRKIPAGMLAELAEAGPEYSNLIAQMAQSSDEELGAVVDAWQSNAVLARATALQEMGLIAPGAADSAEAAATAIVELADEYREAGETIPDEVIEGILIGYPELTGTAKELAEDIVTELELAPDSAEWVGRMIAEGVKRGIDDNAWRATQSATRLGNSTNWALQNTVQVYSPSKFAYWVGSMIPEGEAGGITDNAHVVTDAIARYGEMMKTQMLSQSDQLNAALAKHESDYQYEKEKELRAYNRSVADIHQDAADEGRSLSADEKWELADMERTHNRDMLEMQEDYQKERLEMFEQSGLDIVEAGERYIENQQWLGQISIQEEIVYWNQMYRALDSGSEAYERALSNHQSRVADLRSQIEQTNESYSSKINQVNENYTKNYESIMENHAKESARIEEQKNSAIASANSRAATDRANALKSLQSDSKRVREQLASDLKALDQQYDEAVRTQTEKLAGHAGSLWDRWLHPQDVPEGQLVANMRSQLEGLQAYDTVMVELEGRIESEALIAELRGLGVDSISELEALNRLSDDELAEYVAIYDEKFELARKRAVDEMAPLKDELAEEASRLQKQAEKDLAELQAVYNQTMAAINAEVRRATAEAVATASAAQRQLNKDTEESLDELNEETEKELTELEQAWVDAVEKIVAKTDEGFDSMYQVGVDAITKLQSGMTAQEPALIAQANRIAGRISSIISSALEVDTSQLPEPVSASSGSSGSGAASSRSSRSSGAGGGGVAITQNVTINSPSPTSPSDNARALKRTAQSLAMEY